jgi:2-keto-4-pentenoate hydratase/2-oxohepta-3-ene-1,7-dioic acid hydratase in catechol pathway
MTGTPAGVAALQVGDQLSAELQDWLRIETNVIAKN